MLRTTEISTYSDKINFLEILKDRFSKNKYNSIIRTVTYNKELLELQSSLSISKKLILSE